MWKVIICEQDVQVCARLGNGLRRFGEDVHEQLDIVYFDSAEALLTDPHPDADVVMLDARLPDASGFDVARTLRRRGFGPLLFIITDEQPYSLEGFAVHAFGYIDKPVDQNQLRSQLDDALITLRRGRDTQILLRRSTNTDLLDSEEILFVEALGHTITATLKDGTQRRSAKPLAELEKQLCPRGFFRCHKSYLINLNHLRSIAQERLTLAGGHVVPLSKHRRREFLQAVSKR